jgi:hypothetical protein
MIADAMRAFIDSLNESDKEAALRKGSPDGTKQDRGITEAGVAQRAVSGGARPPNAADKVRDNVSKMRAATGAQQTDSAAAKAQKNPWHEEVGNPWTDKLAAGKTVFEQRVNPLVLVNELNKKYKQDWVHWEPETLWHTIEADYKTKILPESEDKIMAVRVLLSNDTFWVCWEVFEKICAALSGRVPSFGTRDDLSVGELSLGVSIAGRIKKREFEHEVMAYVAVEAKQEGYVLLPKPLAFAQDILDSLSSNTEGADVKKKLLDSGVDSIKVTDPEDPVHVQAGHLKAISAFVEKHDNENVKV